MGSLEIVLDVSLSRNKWIWLSVKTVLTNQNRNHMNHKMTCAPSEDAYQSRQMHLPRLIRVFPVLMKKPWVLSYPLSIQRRLWSVWADAQADLSLRWVHWGFCWFCCAAACIWIKERQKQADHKNTNFLRIVKPFPWNTENEDCGVIWWIISKVFF